MTKRYRLTVYVRHWLGVGQVRATSFEARVLSHLAWLANCYPIGSVHPGSGRVITAVEIESLHA